MMANIYKSAYDVTHVDYPSRFQSKTLKSQLRFQDSYWFTVCKNLTLWK